MMPLPAVLHSFKRKHKYGVSSKDKRTADGILFDSQLEMRVYLDLKLEQRAGTVLFFLRQVPFHLPGNSRFVCDFAVFRADGTVNFIDSKGMETESFRLKRRMVEELYHPVTIKVVTKASK